MNAKTLLPIMIVWSLAACGLRGEQAVARRFIWDEANSRTGAARTPADFLAAARAYEGLVAAGVRSGPLFYNLGIALLKAGEYDAALAALLRAERYEGTNPDIERNLRLAFARGQTDRSVSLPWYRVPLFWHYGLAAPVRLTVAAVAFSLCWLALLLRFARWARGFARPLLTFAAMALILFGSSAATSLREEALADAQRSVMPQSRK
jgi:hypothetical protein